MTWLTDERAERVSMNTAEKLAAALGPARAGLEPVPWAESRDVVGFDFPSDYRWLADNYGGIRFNDEFSVWIPQSEPLRPGALTGFGGFVDETVSEVGSHFRWAKENGYEDECPYPVFPDPGGLLGWGSNFEGDFCFWLTEGADPDMWPVAIWRRQNGDWLRFAGGAVEFLVKCLEGDEEQYADIGVRPSGEAALRWRHTADWGGWSRFCVEC